MRRALVDPRIARMVRRDQQVAIASMIALWLLYTFVFYQITELVSNSLPSFFAVSIVAGASILFLNTMSIYAMIRRYSINSEIARIYGPEIQCDQNEDCDAPNSWLE